MHPPDGAGARPSLDDFPPLLFDHFVARIIELEPAAALPVLCVSGRFNQAASRALFEELEIADDDSALLSPARRSRLETVLRFPDRYSRFVRAITIVPRKNSAEEDDDEVASASSFFSYRPKAQKKPLAKDRFLPFISTLESLEAVIWITDRVPFGDFCSSLAQAAPGLSVLICRPNLATADQNRMSPALLSTSPSIGAVLAVGASNANDTSGETTPRQEPTRWHAEGISNLPCLRELSLSHLSSDGARALTLAMSRLPHLEYLTLDFLLLEDVLLAAVATNCKRLNELTIRTSGTKMTDKAIITVLEGCVDLRTLVLTEVEGRLSKKLWTKLDTLPETFKTVRVALDEVGPHHSWTTEHLNSIFLLLELAPSGLSTFCVTRIVPPAALQPAVTLDALGLGAAVSDTRAIGTVVPPCDEVVAPRPLPAGALNSLKGYGHTLRELEIDMFSLRIEELKVILESCPHLELLRIYLEAPHTKMLAMTSSFVPLVRLHTLIFSIAEQHCPKPSGILQASPLSAPSHFDGEPSASCASPASTKSALLPELSPSSSLSKLSVDEDEVVTPGASPRMMTKSFSRSSFSEHANASVPTPAALAANDPTIPPKREIRRFARRCPGLRLLRWTGRNGKGEWHISGSQIDFVPVGTVHLEAGTLAEPTYDASLARRVTSSTAALREKRPISINAMLADEGARADLGSPHRPEGKYFADLTRKMSKYGEVEESWDDPSFEVAPGPGRGQVHQAQSQSQSKGYGRGHGHGPQEAQAHDQGQGQGKAHGQSRQTGSQSQTSRRRSKGSAEGGRKHSTSTSSPSAARTLPLPLPIVVEPASEPQIRTQSQQQCSKMAGAPCASPQQRSNKTYASASDANLASATTSVWPGLAGRTGSTGSVASADPGAGPSGSGRGTYGTPNSKRQSGSPTNPMQSYARRNSVASPSSPGADAGPSASGGGATSPPSAAGTSGARRTSAGGGCGAGAGATTGTGACMGVGSDRIWTETGAATGTGTGASAPVERRASGSTGADACGGLAVATGSNGSTGSGSSKQGCTTRKTTAVRKMTSSGGAAAGANAGGGKKK